MTTTETPAGYVGQPVARKEDRALVTGAGQYIDDLSIPGQAHMALVRSPHAHARVLSVDLSAALAADGVIAAYSGSDLRDDWAAGLPCAWPVTEDTKIPDHFPLTHDKARYVGDGVAVVVAESRALARDAAELVSVEYETLDVVTDVVDAAAIGAPMVHETYGTNESYTWVLEAGEVDALFESAAVTTKERYRQQRLIPNAIEPRGVIAQPAPDGDFTLYSATQIPHILRTTLSMVTGVAEARIRVVTPEVGGGFGSKINVYAEEALALALAKRLERPIKWVADRSEGYLATTHGRDVVQEIELAATAEGRITAVRVNLLAAMGAYMQLVTPGIPILGAWLYGGTYDIEAYALTCTGVFTNTTPTDAYRGAGRPEATYAIEHAIDALARKLGTDPVELRRLNFISEFPAAIASGLEIDSGDFHGALDRGLELLGYEAVRRDQEARRTAGEEKLLGVGFSTYVEMCGIAPSRILGAVRYGAGGWEAATIRCLPTGTVQAIVGTSPHGQGHVTTFSQLVADRLGVPIESVEVLHGDTAVAPLGMDTYGSRSLSVGGVAVWHATEKIIAKAKLIAAHHLEVSPDDLEYSDGTFTVRGTDRSATVADAAFQAWTAHDLPDGMEPGLEETAVFDPENFSWPGGCHIAVVEVDTTTGDARLIRYIAVDDVGNVVNPTIVDGQVQGGIAQGVGQALYEEAVYDADGNLATGSMTNYVIPSSAELPSFELGRVVAPSPSNPMGVKGVGETGAIASTAAVMNAVVDALSHLGVQDIDMPASPERVWRAIEEARA
ncbi:MAG: xanthine dehydrogenase family protein molybdopterin-binding subunit [Gaiellales bacterium]